MDNPKEAINSNVQSIRPNTQIVSDRNKELVSHFVQMLSEDTASGMNVDSVQFVFIGTHKDKYGEYDTASSHHWIDILRNPARELSYAVSLIQSDIQAQITASQDDEE